MNRPVDTQLPTKTVPSKGSRPDKSQKVQRKSKNWYLIVYNAASAILWAIVLGRVQIIGTTLGVTKTFPSTFDYVKYVQTFAVLEILHAAAGIVRAPVLTTLMQVSSRLLLVWGIAYNFPQSTASSPAWASMLVAWSVTEVIRYSYFAVIILTGAVPDVLTWLRYNTFFILYPLGISSECWLVYKALGPARALNEYYAWALVAVLVIYIPGSYILFTHMMSQRRKVMRSLTAQSKSQ